MFEPTWNTIEDVRNAKTKAEVLAIGLSSWGHCMAGNKPPEHFGMMMIEVGNRLSVSPTPQNLHKKYEEWKNGLLVE